MKIKPGGKTLRLSDGPWPQVIYQHLPVIPLQYLQRCTPARIITQWCCSSPSAAIQIVLFHPRPDSRTRKYIHISIEKLQKIFDRQARPNIGKERKKKVFLLLFVPVRPSARAPISPGIIVRMPRCLRVRFTFRECNCFPPALETEKLLFAVDRFGKRFISIIRLAAPISGPYRTNRMFQCGLSKNNINQSNLELNQRT